MDYRLSSVNFQPSQSKNVQENEIYSVYIKESLSSSEEQGLSFYDALGFFKEEPPLDHEEWRCISTKNNQALELHFRSHSEKRIIAVTIDLLHYHLDISSFVWYQHKKAFLKIDYPETLDSKLIELLLQRILIKYKGKTAFLSMNEIRGGVTSWKI
ncbi:hypothetical protein FIU87_18835 [Bacillus sp. THAF10]|uniref:hypothetical protein n=1 Tax=Bacillus sp. THAF10 TaxID=2587848 RepID=UPI00126812F9|nr:hypothetical protein [Bacillus sp. THAF10]QFT90705.1 hypothetical protein FIU87_18835 [Bacillus sp. THAF10]